MKIDKGIPIPTTPTRWKDVFAALEIGDSFVVNSEFSRVNALNRGRVFGVKLKSRKQADGFRIWRVA